MTLREAQTFLDNLPGHYTARRTPGGMPGVYKLNDKDEYELVASAAGWLQACRIVAKPILEERQVKEKEMAELQKIRVQAEMREFREWKKAQAAKTPEAPTPSTDSSSAQP